MSTLFKDVYGLGETQIGLTFIANGAGSMIGALITGKLLDIDYRRIMAKHKFESTETVLNTSQDIPNSEANLECNYFPLEKARLHLVPFFAILHCMSIILCGWNIRFSHQVHIAVPIVSTFVTGWTAVSTQSVVMMYLVDVFVDRSAATSASLNPARCLFAAGGTSAIMPIVNGIGVGWALAICVAVQFVPFLGLIV